MKRNLILSITVFLLVVVVTQVYMVCNNKNLNVIEEPSDSENTYIAFYLEDDTTSLSIMPSKDDGYVLDKENSYCEVNGEKSNEVTVSLTNDWKVQIHGLSNSRTRCNLHFKKSPDPFINPKETVDAATGNGLYKVEHGDLTSEEGGIPAEELDGWKTTEWRYAGLAPDNYVWFNCGPDASSGETCEKWRIIGLVNVKIDKGNGQTAIEQRIKIIRADPIKANEKNFSWDYKTSGKGSSITRTGSNDWTDSQLMEMLNDIYYESHSGSCYQGSDSPSTCNFTSTGLKESARDMIDKEIIWNLGGSSTDRDVTVSYFYERERGTSVYTSGLPFARETEWQASNTGRASKETTNKKVLDPSLFRSIALLYPSDYGFATSGGSTGRDACFEKELYNWKNDYADCGNNDWLKPESGWMWTLSPHPSSSNSLFTVLSSGYVFSSYVHYSDGVWPALYLSPSVSISGGEGSSTVPFELSVQ